MFRSFLVFICFTCFYAPTPAIARCEGAIMLLQMHDAYLATLTSTGATQISGATTLSVVVGGNPRAFRRQMARAGIELDETKLATAMQEAAALAKLVLTRAPLPHDTFKHSQNIQWLGDIAERANCHDAIVATDWSQPRTRTSIETPDKFALGADSTLHALYAAGAASILLIAAFAVKRLRKSKMFLARQMERLPRSPTSFTLPVTFTDPQGEMRQFSATALDLSTGGMKLDWPDAPPPGTILTVSLSSGERLARVAWSNAFFAGIVFDSPLSKRETAGILSEASQESKTAPEGAASPA